MFAPFKPYMGQKYKMLGKETIYFNTTVYQDSSFVKYLLGIK